MGDLVVLGVDPAATRLAIVAFDGSNHSVFSYPRLGKSGGEACANAARFTEQAVGVIKQQFPGALIEAFVESAVVGRGGVLSTMVQCFTSGAVQGKLHELGVPTRMANVSTWKKNAVGRGNATKEDVGESLRLRWPAVHAEARGNQDVFDAASIAIYGWGVVQGRMA